MNANMGSFAIHDIYSKQLNGIKSRSARVGVIGLGFVGLPLAVNIASNGFNVSGFDIDKNKLNKIRNGEIQYNVPSSQICELVSKHKLLLESNPKKLSAMDIVIICVPTPLKSNSITPDLEPVKKAYLDLISNISFGTLVILESTVYTNFTEDFVVPLFEKNGFKIGENVFIAFSPERIDPGSIYNLEDITKIVSGYTTKCTELVYQFYKTFIRKVLRVNSIQVAEMTKLLENTYRYVNIALINEFTKHCETFGVNIWEVLEAAETKPFGFHRFDPGPGVGGHCIPVDPFYLKWIINNKGLQSKLIDAAYTINSNMPYYIINRLVRDYQETTGNKIKSLLIIGVTYKKDINDVRESSAFKIIEEAERLGIYYRYSDPFVPVLCINNYNTFSLELNSLIIQEFDAVLLHTDHSCIDYKFIGLNANFIFDARGAFRKRGLHLKNVIDL